MPKAAPKIGSPGADLEIRAVTSADWPAFECLFKARGSPKNCWCMAMRGTSDERRSFTAAQGSKSAGRALSSGLRRDAIRSRIEADTPVGLLAFADGDPVAWCSVAPRSTYRRLGGPDDFPERPDAVWSITCFFIARPWRGHGLTTRLIAAAIAYAGKEGAAVIEAYPVPPDATSYRFMGLAPVFAAAGFHQVGNWGTRRTVMRLRL